MKTLDPKNLTYIAKLNEDPYSSALLEEIQGMLTIAEEKLNLKHFELNPHQVYALLGYIHALKAVMNFQEEAILELSAFPEA